MLVLGRKENDSVIITTPSGEVIKVMVVAIAGGQIRLGFDADRSVTIDREEVHTCKK